MLKEIDLNDKSNKTNNEQKEQSRKRTLKVHARTHLTNKNSEENQEENFVEISRSPHIFNNGEYGSFCGIETEYVFESLEVKPYDLELMTGNSSNDKEGKDE